MTKTVSDNKVQMVKLIKSMDTLTVDNFIYVLSSKCIFTFDKNENYLRVCQFSTVFILECILNIYRQNIDIVYCQLCKYFINMTVQIILTLIVYIIRNNGCTHFWCHTAYQLMENNKQLMIKKISLRMQKRRDIMVFSIWRHLLGKRSVHNIDGHSVR